MKAEHFSWRSGAVRPKVYYSSKQAADKAAIQTGKHYNLPMSSYQCRGCKGWHIGADKVYTANQAGLTKLFADFVGAALMGKTMPLKAIIDAKKARFKDTKLQETT